MTTPSAESDRDNTRMYTSNGAMVSLPTTEYFKITTERDALRAERDRFAAIVQANAKGAIVYAEMQGKIAYAEQKFIDSHDESSVIIQRMADKIGEVEKERDALRAERDGLRESLVAVDRCNVATRALLVRCGAAEHEVQGLQDPQIIGTDRMAQQVLGAIIHDRGVYARQQQTYAKLHDDWMSVIQGRDEAEAKLAAAQAEAGRMREALQELLDSVDPDTVAVEIEGDTAAGTYFTAIATARAALSPGDAGTA